MRKVFFIQLALLMSQLNLVGQIKTSTVRAAILSADTVLIVSHNLTYGDVIQEGSEPIPPPLIVENERPNSKIIHETVILTDSLRNRLIKILTESNKSGRIEMAGCFMPHHAVLLTKNGKTSFIEICFGCRRIFASDDIGTDDIQYAQKMWVDLERFFSANGIHYQIPFNIKDP